MCCKLLRLLMLAGMVIHPLDLLPPGHSPYDWRLDNSLLALLPAICLSAHNPFCMCAETRARRRPREGHAGLDHAHAAL